MIMSQTVYTVYVVESVDLLGLAAGPAEYVSSGEILRCRSSWPPRKNTLTSKGQRISKKKWQNFRRTPAKLPQKGSAKSKRFPLVIALLI